MKLTEIQQSDPIFAWLEPATGPENLKGVRLACIDPLKQRFEKNIQNAEEEQKPDRVRRLKQQQASYAKRGQTYFMPDFGWWISEESFNRGEHGFGGVTKGQVLARNPSIQIVSSRKEAESLARDSGLI